MKRFLFVLSLLFILSSPLMAYDQRVASFHLKTRYAGERIRLYKTEATGYKVIHEIDGSGVDVLVSKEYPASKAKGDRVTFQIGALNFSISLYDNYSVLYLEGYQVAEEYYLWPGW